jgi:glycosyltransferase involved in cell wall biosynthesis
MINKKLIAPPLNSQNKIRIAIVYSHFPHYREPVFKCLSASNDFKYDFFFSENKKFKSIKSGSQSVSSKPLSQFTFKNFIVQFGFSKYLLKKEYSKIILLGNPNILSMWWYAILAKIMGIEVFFWTHGWLKEEKGLKKLFRNSFYKLADGLLLYGNRAKKIGINNGFSKEKLHVIYNSLDYSRQKNEREKLENQPTPSSNEIYFSCIGRNIPSLNLKIAIDALKIVKDIIGLNIPLHHIGSGSEDEALSIYAQEKGVNLKLMGAIYDESEIGAILYYSRAIISPGKVGLTAMHSLAYGIPVVTHNDFDSQMPEVESLVDGLTGGFFTKDDPEDLARELITWVNKEKTEAEKNAAIQVIEDKYSAEQQVYYIEQGICKTKAST